MMPCRETSCIVGEVSEPCVERRKPTEVGLEDEYEDMGLDVDLYRFAECDTDALVELDRRVDEFLA